MATSSATVPVAHAIGRQATRRKKARRAAWTDLLNAAPAIVLYSLLLVVPGFIALALSLFRWNGIARPKWVGLANWLALARDGQALSSFLITIEATVIGWLVIMTISIVAGVSTAGSGKAAAFLAGLYVLPLLLSTAGLALIWQALLAPSLGGIAYLGTIINIPIFQTNWLGNSSIVVFVITGIMCWQFIPFYTLMYRVARQRIPDSLYEAASVDGAGGTRMFLSITLPQLRSTIVSASLLLIVGTLAYFDLFFLLTGGGPGTASEVLSLYTYKQGFASENFGYASTLTVVLVLIGVIAGAVLLVSTRYSSESREGGE